MKLPLTLIPAAIALISGSTFAATAWNSATVYTGGELVTYAGKDYKAKWWTQNNIPGADQWGPWELITKSVTTASPAPSATPQMTASPIPTATSVPSPTPSLAPTSTPRPTATAAPSATPSPTLSPTPTANPTTSPTVTATATPAASSQPAADAWNSTMTYTAGKRVSYNGRAYEAKWYTVGDNPAQSGAYGVWKDLGPVLVATPSPSPTATPASSPATTTSVSAVQATSWKYGATAAYSMMHDDLCAWVTDGQIDYAAPALKARGLISSFGMITGSTCGAKHWAAAQQFLQDGHEIFSHTRNHSDANSALWDMAGEISGSSDDIAAHLNGYRPTFFAWPSGVAADAPMAYLRTAAGYIGGRAANRVDANGMVIYDGHIAGINGTTVPDAYQVRSEMFTLSAQYSEYEAQVKAGGDLLNLHLDAGISKQGWAVMTMHGVNDSSWNSVPLQQYTKHLDYVKAKVDAGVLWVAGPSEVLKYTYAREACKPILNAAQTVLTFDTSAADCVKNATPLTLKISKPAAVGQLYIEQAGQAITIKPLGNYPVWTSGQAIPAVNYDYLITVNPVGGAVNFMLK